MNRRYYFRRVLLSGTIFLIVVFFFGCSRIPLKLYERIQPESQQFTATEILLQFKDGMPYLTLEIEHKPIKVFLDTGAKDTTIALAPDIVDTLSVRQVGGPHFVRTNYGTSMYRKFLLPEVNIGGLTYYNLLCDRYTGPAPSPSRHSGVIGLALLQDFNVLIDYKAAQMILYRKDMYPEDNVLTTWQKMPFFMHDDGILLKGTFKGNSQELTFMLDTGGVGRDENNESFNPMKGSALATLGNVPTEEKQGYQIVRSQDLLIGDVMLSALNFVFVNALTQPPSINGGFLGYDFFLKYRVFFDFAHATMYIQRQT